MKNIILAAFMAVLVVFSASCRKEDRDILKGDVEKVPVSYSKKVMLEYFCGAWCTFCPDGDVHADMVENEVGSGNFISYVIHQGDSMSFDEGNVLIKYFNPPLPTGLINRIDGKVAIRNKWVEEARREKTQTAMCGLKIDATQQDGDNYNVKVSLGIGSEGLYATKGNYFMTVVAVAEELSGSGTGWDQVNYYNNTAGHPFYQKGDPIKGYIHKNTAIDFLSPPFGDTIDMEKLKAGKLSKFEYTFNLHGYDASNIEIIAFISEFYDNPDQIGVESSNVYNARKVSLGTRNEFD